MSICPGCAEDVYLKDEIVEDVMHEKVILARVWCPFCKTEWIEPFSYDRNVYGNSDNFVTKPGGYTKTYSVWFDHTGKPHKG